jgi:2-oxoglutarate dehydrogenase E2 component (dihydrolipoamide succinyltransferase)
MSNTVTMPQLGETVTEGTILRWVKQPGDTVAEDDVLLEISTDKVDTEVPSPFAGTLLEVLVPEGATVDVGTALAVIGDPSEAGASPPAAAEPAPAAPAPAPAAPAAPPAPTPEPAAPPAPAPAVPSAPAPAAPPPPPPAPPPVPATAPAAPAVPAAAAPGTVDVGVLSPVVRRLAAEYGVDLGAVTGTGRGGRITRRDVEVFVSGAGVAAAAKPAEERKAGLGRGIGDLLDTTPAPPQGVVAPTPPPAAPAPAADQAAPTPVATGSVEEPLSRLRTRIATNMIKSKQTAAHVWTSMEVDFEAVERVRRTHRPAFKEREGFSLTYLPFIARATMDALAEFPIVNSSFDLDGGTRTIHGDVNLGIGVDLNQEGLVVMTIRGADGLRMRGIAREVRRLADKAREGKMEPDDLAGSTFTITNPGPYGSFMSAPIINVPNVAILSTDGIKKRPVVVTDNDGNDAIAIHHVGYLGLTWDHRAFDGSTAVLFLRHIKENLETWDWDQELA